MAEEMKQQELTTDEFKELAKRMLPHLYTIQDIMLEANMTAYITVDFDGYINLRLSESDWQFTKFAGGRTVIEHSYKEEINLEEEAPAC